MDEFSELINAHDTFEANKAKAAQSAADKETAAVADRTLAFTAAVKQIAMPVFNAFVEQLKQTGRDAATFQLSNDGYGRAYVQLRFNVDPNARLNLNASEDCAYGLTLMESGIVEFRSYYDQRPGKNGHSTRPGGIDEITTETIRDDLKAVLQLGLDSRKS
ncbi:hypothetical protein [Paraburkholderia dipogonis]|uniref:hypothetical protein n=1 Tax=Paraburkholderia dipogonis TaxID=1211383 RepID=UPI0038B8A9C4